MQVEVMKLTKSPSNQGLYTQRKGLELWCDTSAITKQCCCAKECLKRKSLTFG